MVMFTPSQSHSGDVIVKPYTGNIAQELQFLTGEKKTNLILRLGSLWQPSNKVVMAMFMPSQSHSGGLIFKTYTGNIAQELQFLTEMTGKKNQPHF